MKHLCKNFIEKGICIKCNKPEWAIYFPEFQHKIGSKVRLPFDFTYAREELKILKKEKRGYIIGKSKDEPMSWFDWWELYPLLSSGKEKRQ